ncbi:hypothetical protein GWK47_048847 [Chionoecetes opilio]|uniref:Uncharacterized protein n=1 Tax=Chionoecetes opilio TaxID=41210 RepID=A0A8J4Y4B0_CHIOP|nr:hypothetical protein GWK47_048847 [Chionoecetes opilio]
MWDGSEDELELVSAYARETEDDELIDMTPITNRVQKMVGVEFRGSSVERQALRLARSTWRASRQLVLVE